MMVTISTFQKRNEIRKKLLVTTLFVVFGIPAALITWTFVSILTFGIEENREGPPAEPPPATFPFHWLINEWKDLNLSSAFLLIAFLLLVFVLIMFSISTYQKRDEVRKKLLAITWLIVLAIPAAFIAWLVITVRIFSIEENRNGPTQLEPPPTISFPFQGGPQQIP
jgi:NADH:ubiquinone oxidoreductase subunit 6 (subunit J)